MRPLATQPPSARAAPRRPARALASLLVAGLAACVQRTELRYDGALHLGADPELVVAHEGPATGVIVPAGSRLVVTSADGSETVPGPLSVSFEPGLLQVSNALGERRFDDTTVRSLVIERPDDAGTTALVVSLGSVAAVGSVFFLLALTRIGEL